jgi:hypothetical protein
LRLLLSETFLVRGGIRDGVNCTVFLVSIPLFPKFDTLAWWLPRKRYDGDLELSASHVNS